MLSQLDIDTLKYKIDNGEQAHVYYVAHMIEGRETNTLDEHSYKSVSDFKVVKIEVEDIQNAYFEYLEYKKDESKYHIEEEECYYYPIPNSEGEYTKYIHHFVVPNGKKTYKKDLNARMPAIIYGYTRKVNDNIIIDETPVKPIYIHFPEYCTMNRDDAIAAMENKKLNWKYMKLEPAACIDGIEYDYLTSDWYILTLKNYPMVEKPLIIANERSGYFMNIADAFSYIEQLKA